MRNDETSQRSPQNGGPRTSVTGGWRFDDYIHSPLGLPEGTTWSAGADVTWMPVERVSFSAGYIHEVIFQKQQSQSRIVNSDNTVPFFPDYVWLSNNIDTVDTFYIGANVAVIPGRLDWKVGMKARNARNHAGHGGSVACGVRADGFEDRIEVDLRPNRCRVAQIAVKDGGDSDGAPRGAMTEARTVLVVDDDAAMRRWKACFVRSDCGSKSPRLRMSSAVLIRICLAAQC